MTTSFQDAGWLAEERRKRLRFMASFAIPAGNLYEQYVHNPAVNACLEPFVNGETTFDQALANCVIVLSLSLREASETIYRMKSEEASSPAVQEMIEEREAQRRVRE